MLKCEFRRAAGARPARERMKMSASSEIFLFGEFRLDRAGGGLFRRDADGVFVPVAIGSRALEILAALVERRGDIVRKEEIMGLGWPRTAVAESNLFVQIAALRRILDAAQSGQSCIQTVTGRGYRFIAPVTRCAVGMDQHPWDLSRTGVEPSLALANERSPEPQPSSISSAERRQLTVMICDLVGVMALAARLDPEDLREIIAAYHRAIAEIATGFDGLVGEHMSDGVMVYFGYPRAHEDDAERAVRAGLGAIDAVGRLDVGAGTLQARVGIATGLVVVGDPIGEGPGREQSVVGEAPHLAAGLLALAEPDTVVIAPGTRRLVGALFEYRDLGAVAVRGIVEPVTAWQVLHPSIVASRFEALRGLALSRWLAARRRSACCCAAGPAPRRGTARSCWSRASPASASRASPRHWRSASIPSRIFACGISARPITRTARFIPLLTSSVGHRGSLATIRPRPDWRSSRRCWPAPPRPTRILHSSPISCHCRARSAIRCQTSVRSGRRKEHWRR